MSGGRRDYDNPEALEQRLLRAIDRQASDNRHLLRNEFAEATVGLQGSLAAIRQDVQAGNLAQVTETARMQASLEELKHDVAELKALEPRVEALELATHTSEAVEQALNEAKKAAEDNRRQNRNWNLAQLAVLVSGLGVLVALIH